MSKSDKLFYNKRVPYEVSILNNFDGFERQNFEVTFKMSKDKENLIDLLGKLLAYNPQERITAKDGMNHAYFD